MAKKKTTAQGKSIDQIFQLRISLEGTKPVVWRRVLVPGIFTLEKLHSVFQMVMGWQMSHLYDFEISGQRYGEEDELGHMKLKSVAASLMSALGESKQFVYNYDFGDDWRHTVEVEKVINRDEIHNYPICIGGENACPPEDCGGAPGFEELKKTISNSSSKEHKSMMQWLGGFYDPFSFDANRINRDFLWLVEWDEPPNEQGLYLPSIMEDASPDSRH